MAPSWGQKQRDDMMYAVSHTGEIHFPADPAVMFKLLYIQHVQRAPGWESCHDIQ